MPESTTTNNARQGGSVVVQRFYTALARGDGDAVTELVGESFAEDVALVLPPSLPYGGTHQGARRLGRMFAAMAGGAAAGGPGELALIDTIDDGDKVVARLQFVWNPPGGGEGIAHEALEMWTFADGRVTEIRGFYWDTHACAEQVRAARA